ncbi:MAG: GTPase ObgE [bacterium]|nr:GTPase ObgE [bacterium]
MKFVDQVTISVEGGHGGAGAVSFRREKYVPKGGPDGGKGGRGGHVILLASTSVQTLMDFRMARLYKAKPGGKGGKKDCSGSNGQDTIVRVPCGTIVSNEDGEILADLVHDGETYIVAKGGQGGRGNGSFATSTNRSPRISQPGEPGDILKVHLELKLLASIGLVGLPNAGKSTLLKALTAASVRIADYPFTTRYPNLGVLKWVDKEAVLADIPGLIEGASKGHGLGTEFLRHIDRTKLLIHVVALDADDTQTPLTSFDVVVKELSTAEYNLLERPSMLVLNKSDLVDEAHTAAVVSLFQERGLTPIVISAMGQLGLEPLKDEIYYSLSRLEDAKPL